MIIIIVPTVIQPPFFSLSIITMNTNRIIVTGFFSRDNLGDDLIEEVWRYLVSIKQILKNDKDYTVYFETVDDISENDLKNATTVILAGGDIINNYFMDKLSSFNGNIIATGVGVPYPEILVNGLDSHKFTAIVTRSKADTSMFNGQAVYFPDLAVYLPQMFGRIPSSLDVDILRSRKNRKNVGVFLTRSVCKGNENYNKVVKGIAESLDSIVTAGFVVTLIPFNTHAGNTSENDILINKDVLLLMKTNAKTASITTVKDMWDYFQTEIDMAITMRFHSHLYSVVAGVPFVSLYTTRKVKNLLIDTGLSEFSYELPKDALDLPTEVNSSTLTSKFFSAWENREFIKNAEETYLLNVPSIDFFEKTVNNALTLNTKLQTNPILTTIQSLTEYLGFPEAASDVYNGVKTLGSLLHANDNVTDQSQFLSSLACLHITKTPTPKYQYGLCEKILLDSFNAKAELGWMWCDHEYEMQSKSQSQLLAKCQHMSLLGFNSTKGLFDATYQGLGVPNFTGCHRSGWSYVFNGCMSFHNDQSPIIFDNYLDRTFHWTNDVYKYSGVLPFTFANMLPFKKQKWCGFIHHTLDTEYSEYNVERMFKNETFTDSLDTCVGLFVMSNDLAGKVNALLQHVGHSTVTVKVFTHPTESVDNTFTMKKLLNNNAPKIVQVGAWLRDNYAIYELNVQTPRATDHVNRIHLQKAALKGKNMDNYFKPDDLQMEFEVPSQSQSQKYKWTSTLPAFVTTNKFIQGVIKAVHRQWCSVEEIDTLSNDEYDMLLSENVIYLNLVDASAVNTVVECIVRNTPVLVNPHPAVVEMLGTQYPFYYIDTLDASMKANDINLIKQTHEYISQMNKTVFTLDYFLKDFGLFFHGL